MELFLAAIGAKALLYLYIWLLSAIAASWLSARKGYGEKAGLGTGLLLTALGPIIWLFVPPKPNSDWVNRKSRRQQKADAQQVAEERETAEAARTREATGAK